MGTGVGLHLVIIIHCTQNTKHQSSDQLPENKWSGATALQTSLHIERSNTTNGRNMRTGHKQDSALKLVQTL
jgi:hypothetical protein